MCGWDKISSTCDRPLSRRNLRVATLLVLVACTYAAPETVVRVANHVYRQGTDSIGIAVYAAEERKPTGIAAFPDGGITHVDHERAMFYLCVAPPGESAPVIRRIAVLPRPDSLRSGFTPWLSGWDGPGRMIGSLRGYVGTQTITADHRMIWIALDLAGHVSPIVNPAIPGSVATSLPPQCEKAALADARATLRASFSISGRR